MNITELVKERILLFDGGMGTMLQQRGLPAGESPELWGMGHPDVVREVHAAYVQAGSDVVTANTFQANALKLRDRAGVREVIAAAMAAAKGSGARYAALDIGPLGQMLEPLGPLTFDAAYALFAAQIRAGAAAGADLVVLETFGDAFEMKIALLAAKENCGLPVIASMTYELSGRTYMGWEARAATRMLCALGADAVGVNCSLGPEELEPTVAAILSAADRPVIVQANAGLPAVREGQAVYAVGPEEYARAAARFAADGAAILGGCCGTTPAYIARIKALCADGRRLAPQNGAPPALVSAGRVLPAGALTSGAANIGEITAASDPALARALQSGDYDAFADEAAELASSAQAIRLCVDLPGADEAAALRQAVLHIQAGCDIPLILAGGDGALDAGARVCRGLPALQPAGTPSAALRQTARKYGAYIWGDESAVD